MTEISLTSSQELLVQALNLALSEEDHRQITQLAQKIQTLKLQQFWQSMTAKPGLYVVLAGRVRLIDEDRNYFTTLMAGDCFGEITLFSQHRFAPYAARSTEEPTTLLFLPKKLLKDLCDRHPILKQTLAEQAQVRCEQNNGSVAPPNPIAQWNLNGSPSTKEHLSTQKPFWPSPSLRVGHLWQRVTQRYPFFAQQSPSDCGAACLVMISRYWGRMFNINHLRELANVDRNGASLAGLSIAAEKLGFTARPVKGTLQSLAKTALPAIAHWEGKHYIVVYEITRRHVIVCDPAIGQLILSHATFNQGWTRYALLLEPTHRLHQTPDDLQSFWQFWDLIKPHRIVLLEVFIASVLIQCFGLITPLLTQILLDQVVAQKSTTTLATVGFGLLMFSLFRVVMTGLRQYLLDHTANKIDLALIVGFISHTFSLPLKFFETRYVGDILARVQENQKLRRFLTGEAITFVLDLLTIFVYIGLMLQYSWKMALLVLLVIPPFAILALASTPFLQRVSREIFKSMAEETGYLIQALTGVRTVKSMAAEPVVRWHWEGLLNQYVRKSFGGQAISNTLQITSGTVEAVATTGLLWFGASLVIQDQLTIGQLVAFNMLLINVLNPFRRLTVLWSQFQEVLIAVERLQDVLDADPEEVYGSFQSALPPIKGHIRLDSVTFRYNTEAERNVLENLSFEVQPGQMVAVVGRSGSGKSTLAKLLLNLYAPTDGKIYIDGCDITQVSMRSLRQQVGVVDQDTFLFSGTIRENITVTHPDVSLDDVIKAATLAGAHSFIQNLPMRYEMQIGESGGLLSGGQRQRIVIARALIGNPNLLIFDEATSALDNESERIIQTNLGAIQGDRTTIVIAHRFSTIRRADLILVLDEGRLREKGTFDELIAQNGLFSYLYKQQFED
jgi:HlyB family type I secretion system ABC transporter